MRKRTSFALIAASLLLCVFAIAVVLRWEAPPATARLLPASDAIAYVNLGLIRDATHFDRETVQPSESYRGFIKATGILLERDLDSGALAVHRMADPNGPNGAVGFSWVFEGRFDSARLRRYLAGLATSQETYAGRVVYSIPSEGRTLRVAVLGYDLVAGSNMPTAEQIHSILDRRRAAWNPFAGSLLLNALYKEVPAFSTAWAIGQIGLPFSEDGRVAVAGVELPVRADGVFVGSVGVAGLHPSLVAIRVDQIAPDAGAAARAVQSCSGLLSLFRGLQPVAKTPSELAVRQIVDSVRIEQHGDRASLTATLPRDALRKLNPSP